MALKPTAISYKDNIEDKILREWIHSHSNLSGFVKDILRAVMKNEEGGVINPTIKNENETNQLIDLGDF